MTTISVGLSRAWRVGDSRHLNSNPLVYDLVPIDKPGGHFNGRLEVRPRLDLSLFRTRAVIDWIKLRIELGAETQPRHVGDCLAKAYYPRPYVTDEAGENEVTTPRVSVKFQEPTPEKLTQALSALHARWGVLATPEIEGIEIAVDWYVNDSAHSEAEQTVLRAQMFTLLHRHFRPTEMLDLTGKGQPRFFREEGPHAAKTTWLAKRVISDGEATRAFLGVNVTLPLSAWAALDLARHTQPTIDSTVYYGAKDADVMVRIQNKVTDRRREHHVEKLSAGERRARIEVTLWGAALEHVGLERADDLSVFKFESLRKQIFGFAGVAVPRKLLRRLLPVRVFERSGVHGLERYLRASSKRSARLRRGWRREEHRRLPARRQVLGGVVKLPAFEKLHKRTDDALRRLSSTWSGYDSSGQVGST